MIQSEYQGVWEGIGVIYRIQYVVNCVLVVT